MRISVALTLVSLLLIAPVTPLDGATFTATLNSIRIVARPGQSVTREFRLTLDPEQRKTRFTAHMQDWWRSEDGSQSFYRDPGTLS